MAKGRQKNVLSSFCQTTKFQKRNVDTKQRGTEVIV